MKDDLCRYREIIEELRALDPKDTRVRELVREAIEVAPDTVEAVLREAGVFPPAVFVNDVGEVIYTPEQVSEWFGIPLDEIVKKCSYFGPIHRIQ